MESTCIANNDNGRSGISFGKNCATFWMNMIQEKKLWLIDMNGCHGIRWKSTGKSDWAVQRSNNEHVVHEKE